jgi:protein TonB
MKPNFFVSSAFILIICITACEEEHISYPMPTYIGGYENLARTIKKHLKYPGRRCCISGNVYVSFVVEADGRISNKKVVKGISSSQSCNADLEALRAVDYLTEWQPAEREGQKISVRMILPINFSL